MHKVLHNDISIKSCNLLNIDMYDSIQYNFSGIQGLLVWFFQLYVPIKKGKCCIMHNFLPYFY